MAATSQCSQEKTRRGGLALHDSGDVGGDAAGRGTCTGKIRRCHGLVKDAEPRRAERVSRPAIDILNWCKCRFTAASQDNGTSPSRRTNFHAAAERGWCGLSNG